MALTGRPRPLAVNGRHAPRRRANGPSKRAEHSDRTRSTACETALCRRRVRFVDCGLCAFPGWMKGLCDAHPDLIVVRRDVPTRPFVTASAIKDTIRCDWPSFCWSFFRVGCVRALLAAYSLHVDVHIVTIHPRPPRPPRSLAHLPLSELHAGCCLARTTYYAAVLVKPPERSTLSKGCDATAAAGAQKFNSSPANGRASASTASQVPTCRAPAL